MGDFSFDLRKDFPAPEFPVRELDLSHVCNALVVRVPNHLGDVVMSFPALKQLRLMLPPQFGLAVIAPRYLQSLLMQVECIDQVIPLQSPHRNWSLKELRSVRVLRSGVGILFSNSLRDTLMLKLAGVHELYGSAARGRSLFLERAFDFPVREDHELAGNHQANRLLNICYALGAPKWDGKMPEIRRIDPFELNGEIYALTSHPKLLVLGAGAAYGAAKRWMPENFRTVARYWIGRGGIVAAVGSAAEAAQCDEIFQGLDPKKCTNLAGKTNLPELTELLRSAAAVAANDSGVMHLAAALGTPGTAIFGPTDYTATGPLNPDWHLLFCRRECAPCFSRVCPKNDPVCMKAVTPFMVIRALRKIEKSLNAVKH